MAEADASQPLVPGFEVLIDGQALGAAIRPYVLEVRIEHDVRLPGMLELVLGSGEPLETEVPWIDDRQLFEIGMEAEARLGYGKDVATLLVGDVVSLEPHFALDRLPRLTVRAFDRAHRLQRARRTRTFLDRTDAEIVSEIAREAGLTARAEEAQVAHEYVVQANQTDLEFLKERADTLRYEVFVQGDELFFRPPPEGEEEAATLTMGKELLDFRVRVSGIGQRSELTVRGWDAAKKEAIVGRADEADLPPAMDGRSRGPTVVSDAFGAAPWTLTDRPVFTSGEADALAMAQLGAPAGLLVTGEGVCWGRSDLRAGVPVRIEGVGERYGGRYYVTTSTHRYTAQKGYHTSFRMRRNAS